MTSARGTLALVLLITAATTNACARRDAGGPRSSENYANQGRLRVYGAPRDAAGPRLYRTLAKRPELRDVFDDEGEPDALEVVRGRGDSTRIVASWWRPGAGRPRRIVFESNGGRFVASAPRPLARGRRMAARRERPDAADAVDTAEMEAPAAAPTAAQSLECPIDRQRAECRAYCVGDSTYEWCR